eukprot:scpid15836/ scgid12063/ FYVE and coiled-coil domain-containing protein 1
MDVVHCEKLLDDLTGQVKEIGEHFAALKPAESTSSKARTTESDAAVVTDDDVALQRFCTTLEKVLRHGIKDRITFFGGQRDYWKYLSLALESTRSFVTQVKIVQDLDDVQTSQGKGRALIRVMLTEHSLADAVQRAVSDNKLTSEWFQSEALLRNEKHSSRLIDQLYELSSVSFLLPNDGQSLDSAWPTFARRTFGMSTNVPIAINPGHGNHSGDTAELGQAAVGELAVDETTASDDTHAMMQWAGEGIQAMNRSCWSALHSVLHRMMSRKIGEDLDITLPEDSGQRLKELAALVLLTRENWYTEHQDRLKEVELRCDKLTEQLEEKNTTELALRGELNTMRQSGVSFGQSKSIAEIEVLQTKLKQAEKARDSAKQASKNQEQECDDLKKEYATLQHEVVVSAESLAAIKEQLNFVEVEYGHYKEDMESNQRNLEGRVNSLQSQLQSSSDFLDNITKTPASSRPESPTKPSTPIRLDLLARLQLLNSNMQEESVRRARAEEKEREAVETLADVKARLEHELTTVNFRMTAETMQLQQALEQLESKDGELFALKERVSTANKDGEQTRSDVSALRIENARLTAEYQTTSDKLNRISSSLLVSQKELMALEEQLLTATHERDTGRVSVVKLSNELEEVKGRCTLAEDKMRSLMDEVHELRRRLLQATQQKAELVNKTATLEDEVLTSAVVTWVADDQADACMQCAVEFSLFTRRHHCRHCGRVFCYDCCCKTFQLPSSDQPSRVCNECHDMLHSRRQGVIKSRVYSLMTESQATATLTSSIRQQMLDDSAPAFPVYVPPTPKQSQDDGLQREADTRVQNPRAQPSPVVASVPVKTASVASLAGSSRSLLGTDGRTGTASEDDEIIVLEGGDALDGSPEMHGSQRHSVADLRGTAKTSNAGKPPSTAAATVERSYSARELSQRASSDRNLSQRSNNNSGASTPESMRRSNTPDGTSRPAGRFLPTAMSTPKSHGKGAVRSLSASSSTGQLVPEMSVGPSIRSEFVSYALQPNTMAGEPVDVARAGMRIVWQFRSEPKGIAFGVLFQPNPSDDAKALVAFKRYLSHKQTIQGSIVTPKPGRYILQFSNVSSSNVPCSLWFRHELRENTAS